MAFGRNFPTVCISTTGTSKSVAVPVGASQCRVTNTSTTLIVHVAFGIAAATAVIATPDSATGVDATILGPNSSAIIDVPKNTAFVAAIASGAGPTLVYFELGAEG